MNSNDLHTPKPSGVNTNQHNHKPISSLFPSTSSDSQPTPIGSGDEVLVQRTGESPITLPGSFPFNAHDIEIFEAVDKLNSWVRTPSARTTAWHVVYWLKGESIKWANSKGWASHRRVGVDTKCRGCGGTGRYVDSGGWEFDHCRACNNSGTAHLAFIETTILGRIRWHTPLRKSYEIIRGLIPAEKEEPALDWKPNQPGRELPIHEAARLLNFAELYVPHGRYPQRTIRDCDEYYGEVDDLATYRLYVGSSNPGQCDICGSTEAMAQFGCYVNFGRIEWSAHICGRCDTDLKWERLRKTEPHGLIDHPDIQEWIRRHPVPEPKPTRRVF